MNESVASNISIGDFEKAEIENKKARKRKQILFYYEVAACVFGISALVEEIWSCLDEVYTTLDLTILILKNFSVYIGLVGMLLLASEGIYNLFLKNQVSRCIEEYIDVLNVNDKDSLEKILSNVKCTYIKRVYRDEYGEVCVQGKKSKYLFKIEDGRLVIESSKDSKNALLEKDCLLSALLKYLDPNLPINSYKDEVFFRRESKVKPLSVAFLIICMSMMCILQIKYNTFEGGLSSKYISMVKDATNESYPDMTYGEAFEKFFENPSWKYFKSDEDKDVVEFTGDCTYSDKKVTATIQFIISKDATQFTAEYLAFDGEAQNKLIIGILIDKAFSSGDISSTDIQAENTEYVEENDAEEDTYDFKEEAQTRKEAYEVKAEYMKTLIGRYTSEEGYQIDISEDEVVFSDTVDECVDYTFPVIDVDEEEETLCLRNETTSVSITQVGAEEITVSDCDIEGYNTIFSRESVK